MSRSTKPRASRMRRTFGVVAATGAAAALLFGGTAVVPQASPVLAPQGAEAAAMNLMIRNGNTSMELHVCKDWGWPSGVWYATRCLQNPSKKSEPNGRVVRLAPGKSTPSLEDWDGIHVPRGYRLMRARFNRDGSKTYNITVRGCVTNSAEWTKVQPTFAAGVTDWFRLQKC